MKTDEPFSADVINRENFRLDLIVARKTTKLRSLYDI